jgi:hypothetical protein
MTTGTCDCLADDPAIALAAIRKAKNVVALADESHFIAHVRCCGACGQHFLTLFCERVDWADGDDPQTRVMAPVSEDETRALQAANVAANENAILQIVVTERRFLYYDMPKGPPERLEWRRGRVFIPGHD